MIAYLQIEVWPIYPGRGAQNPSKEGRCSHHGDPDPSGDHCSQFRGLAQLSETHLRLFITLGFGIIGLIDDFIIVVAKRSLGLRAREKLLGQILLAIIFAFYLLTEGEFGPVTIIPFTGNVWQMPPVLFFFMTLFVLVGSANAVNLTDGLDGLAAGTVAIAATAYGIIALGAGDVESAVFAGAIIGACIGFTWFNSYPAQVFMGDTGALGLGEPWGFGHVHQNAPDLCDHWRDLCPGSPVGNAAGHLFPPYRWEADLPDDPLHHHFELSGWPETKVVFRFYCWV